VASSDIGAKLRELREEVWQLARETLDSGEKEAYRALLEIAERLTPLVTTPSSGAKSLDDQRQVFARYKGTTYEAIFDRARVNGGRGDECILFRGEWVTCSKAAVVITKNPVNGWRFWKYRRSDGGVGQIEELR